MKIKINNNLIEADDTTIEKILDRITNPNPTTPEPTTTTLTWEEKPILEEQPKLPKRKTRTLRTNRRDKNWTATEDRYLLDNWQRKREHPKNKKRIRHNKKLAKTLGRTLVACRLRHEELRNGTNKTGLTR